MSVEIVMPKLSDTMEEGTILKWLKQEGDHVARGEVIAEVETDKADMELEAAEEGVLREIKVTAGESAAVGAVIALVEEGARGAGAGGAKPAGDGGAKPAEDGGAKGADDGTKAARAEGAERAARTRPAAKREGARPGAPDTTSDRDASDADEAPVKASAAARQLAEERGVDLRTVAGSGPDGRIVREDVESAAGTATGKGTRVEGARAAARGDGDAAGSGRAAREADAGAARPTEPVAGERQELSRMRQSIAKRMSEAFREIPHFYVTTEIDMGEAVRLKEALQKSELFAAPITYTHMVLKATALALKRHPRLNASFRDGGIELKGGVNLGMAVAVEDGLIVPVLRHVDERSLADIAVEARRLAEQAKQGRFASEDLSGGTFTVSNMGMLDIDHFAAVINPPQAAILAVGGIHERPMVRGGQVVAGRTMRVTISCDHRIIDGVVAGRFLGELKRLLENPVILLVRER